MANEHFVEFLQKTYAIPTERHERRRLLRASRVVALVVCVFAVLSTFLSFHIAKMTQGEASDIRNLSVFSTLTHSFARLVGSGDKPLIGEADDRINVLLLGVGGNGHEGAQLADTIIFGSFQPSTHETGLLSIPRDLVVNIPGYGMGKINHANAYGELTAPGDGLTLTETVVEEMTGQDVHYVVRVDFDGFSQLIDELGGVDVYVERSFTDREYPEYEGSPTYTTVSFTEGWTHMDGARALVYARSRHGNNGEGTDYARAERQQDVLLAVKDKAFSLGVLLNPNKLTRLLDTVKKNLATNISIWEMLRLAAYIPDIETQHIVTKVADVASGLVYETNIEGLGSVALPVKNDWSGFHAAVDALFTPDALTNKDDDKQDPAGLNPTVRVEIQNGTSVTGLAAEVSVLLSPSLFRVVAVGNATTHDVERTIIYDLTDGEALNALMTLEEFLNADVVMTPEGWLRAGKSIVPARILSDAERPTLTSEANVDVLVVLGENAVL